MKNLTIYKVFKGEHEARIVQISTKKFKNEEHLNNYFKLLLRKNWIHYKVRNSKSKNNFDRLKDDLKNLNWIDLEKGKYLLHFEYECEELELDRELGMYNLYFYK